MFKSIAQEIGTVKFPAFMAERVHMQEFTELGGLPNHLARWQSAVDAMLSSVSGIDPEDKIFITIDQGVVEKNTTHRRGGIHIEGYWSAEISCHTGIRDEGAAVEPWSEQALSHPEITIIASDVSGCRAFVGEYSGEILEGGDCSKIDTSSLKQIVMEPGKVYAGNVTMLHESIPVRQDCRRTVVRLSIQSKTHL